MLVILGIICLAIGLFQFFYKPPVLAVNLYTQFPYIENGSVCITGSFALLTGCFYSYKRRYSVLETLVKSKIIEHMREEYGIYLKKPKKGKRFNEKKKIRKKR